MMNQQIPMTNKQKILFCLLGTLFMPFLAAISMWIYWQFYIGQLIHPSFEITGDPLYVMSILFGASIFLGLFAGIFSVYNMLLCIRRRTVFRLVNEINPKTFHKWLLILAIIGGGFAFVSNIILLHKVIPENGYVLCPKKIGYKKNLLRDYVLDIDQCERF